MRRPILTAGLALAFTTTAWARPNIVWLVGEDLGPELGCYGDAEATTPRLNQLAAEGARYTHAFTHAPVCAPSRHGLITGQYPIKTGAMHMRSTLRNPPAPFTRLLRAADYHVMWPGKTDFNFAEPKDLADSRAPWWKGRDVPPQPFFGYANFNVSHESQVRNDGDKYAANTRRLTPEQRHDPARMKLPPYWPDHPEVRQEVARYYDLATAVDYEVGDVLDWLKKHDLEKNTVVIFFGDHGRGMARHKRWVYDSGTRVPLLVRWPGQIPAGEVRTNLVEFLDLTATTVSLAGVPVPAEFDGQVFLGPQAAPPRRYVYAHRDFMDETFDRIRSVRDARFRYIRNFHPERPYAQRIDYMERGRTMQVWREAHAAGKLDAVQSLFFGPRKPEEELYDTESDPHEVRNLAGDPAQAEKLAELRGALDAWLKKTNDLAGRLDVPGLIEAGIIAPRNAEYDLRRERGKSPAP